MFEPEVVFRDLADPHLNRLRDSGRTNGSAVYGDVSDVK